MNYPDTQELEIIKRLGPQTDRERILLEALAEALELEARVGQLEDELSDKDYQIKELEDKEVEKDDQIDRQKDTIDDLKEENEKLHQRIGELGV
jgi:peptidoglycan hydrolase CwlO-like protein